MNVETVREYCLNKKGVTESFPFDDVSLVVKVMNKMFALIDLEEANHIALKCDPEKAIELREHYSGIEGAYHFNKKYSLSDKDCLSSRIGWRLFLPFSG